MIIPYGMIEAVIKRSALERTKNGLSLELIRKYKLDNVRYDDDLLIIPIAMNGPDANLKARELEKDYSLLHLDNNGKALDFVLCSRIMGTFDECDWLAIDYFKKTMLIDGKKYKKGTIFYELKKS